MNTKIRYGVVDTIRRSDSLTPGRGVLFVYGGNAVSDALQRSVSNNGAVVDRIQHDSPCLLAGGAALWLWRQCC
jgi:hypothetical protein